jgi:MinD-like ATPase involved in chromosome partitioning or flagellar assembly
MITTIWGRAGAGKTTVAVNLAMALANKGKIIGVISSNLQYGHLQILFGQTVFDKHGTYKAIEDNDAISHYWKSGINENVFLMSVPNEYCRLDYENITIQHVEDLLAQSSAHFDCVIVDGSEDIGNPISSVALTMSTHVLLLHRPSVVSCSWYASKKEVIPLLRVDGKLIHIVNAYDGSCKLDDYLGRTGINTKLELPFVAEAPLLENMGTPIFISDGKKIREYNTVLNKIVEVISVE